MNQCCMNFGSVGAVVSVTLIGSENELFGGRALSVALIIIVPSGYGLFGLIIT